MVTGFEGYEVPKEKYHVIHPEPVTGTGIQDVYIAEDRYAILATQSGIDIADLYTGAIVSSAIVSGTQVLSVAADWTTATGYLYIGTSTSGILAARWKPLRGPGTDFTGQIQPLYSTTSTLALPSNQINDMDAQPYKLLISTAVGVSFISTPPVGAQHIATKLMVSGSNGCKLTAAGEGYWTVVNSGVDVSYNLLSSTGLGIIETDYDYNHIANGPLLPHNVVNDIDVVEGASHNIINVATASGDFIIEEVQGAESTARSKRLHPEFDVVSAALSNSATFEAGTKYVTTTGILTVYGLVDDTVSGTHHQEISLEDKFLRENTRDQALVTGTITIVRTTGVA